MPLPAIHPAGIHTDPVATIWAPEALPGDVLLVCEHKQLWWRRVLQADTTFLPPSLSRTGWTHLGHDPKAKEDSAWILSGVESVEHDPGSFAQPPQEQMLIYDLDHEHPAPPLSVSEG